MIKKGINNTSSGAVLVAEDDINLGLFWEEWLANEGYAVTRTTNKADALAAFRQFGAGYFVLVVLDMRMPSVRGRQVNTRAGLEAAIEMRKHDSDVPVLFLTAGNDEDIEADALDAGGQGRGDFVRKPCGMRAFQLRVRNMARNDKFRFGPRATIDTTKRVSIIDGQGETPRPLTRQMLELSIVFKRNANASLGRMELVKQWGWNESSLDECIRKLRLAVDDTDHTIIKTLHGVGYIYDLSGK